MLEASVLLYLQGAIIMNANVVRKPEQIKLIMELPPERILRLSVVLETGHQSRNLLQLGQQAAESRIFDS